MWSYRQVDGTSVEFSKKDVAKLYRAGVLLPSTEVWNPSMGSWEKAANTELSELFPKDEKHAAKLEDIAKYSFKDPSKRANTLKRFLTIYSASAVGVLGINLASLSIGSEKLEENEAYAIVALVFILSYIFSYIAAGIGFMRWTKLLSTNAHVINGAALKYSPNFAMWCYLIPIANLWIPRVAISEIWKSSYKAVNRGEQPSGLINIWWGFFIASSVFGNAIAKMDGSSELYLQLSVVENILDLLAAYTAIKIVSAVTSVQIAYSQTSSSNLEV